MSAHQENSTPRTKLSTIIINTNFLGDANLRALFAQHGVQAVALWFPLLCCIASNGGACKLSKLKLQGYAIGVDVDTCEEIIKTAIELELLTLSGDLISCDQIAADIENVDRKRQYWRERKRAERGRPSTIPPVSIECPSGQNGESIPCLKNEHEHEEEYEDLRSEKNLENKDHVTTRAPAKVEAPSEYSDPLLAEADKHLDYPNGQPWTNTNAWICAGRRPMHKYPQIFLTAQELLDTLKEFESALPQSEWPLVFQAVEAKLKTKPPDERNRVSAFGWLTGWALTERVRQTTSKIRLTQANLNGARA